MKTYLTNYHCPDVSPQKLNHYVTVMNLKKTLMVTVKCLPFSCLQIRQSPLEASLGKISQYNPSWKIVCGTASYTVEPVHVNNN